MDINIFDNHDYNDNDDDEDERDAYYFKICDLSLNKSIPKSAIIYSDINNHNDEKIHYLDIAHKLYCKYVEIESELEVNISGDCRQHFIIEMKNKSQFINNYKKFEYIELFELFDEIINEMYELMLTSFQRFMRTDPALNVARLYLSNHDTDGIKKMISS